MTDGPLVFVLEPEPRIRYIVSRQLHEAGYSVINEEDGLRALQALERILPALVLTNIKSPGLDGFEVCRRIRADPRLANVPVVFLTFLSDEDSRARAFACGASAYVTKPWTASELTACVAECISRSGPCRS